MATAGARGESKMIPCHHFHNTAGWFKISRKQSFSVSISPDRDTNRCLMCGQRQRKCGLLDFIKEYFQIFVVIGVFGALSLYLSSFASDYPPLQNGTVLYHTIQNSAGQNVGSIPNGSINALLNSGSLLCLVIVILVSVGLLFKFKPYIRYWSEEDDDNESYGSYFWNTWEIFLLNLFRAFFALIIIIISLYLLFFSNLASVLLNTFFSAALIFLIVFSVYRPALATIKSKGKRSLIFCAILSTFGFLTVFSILYLRLYLSNVSQSSSLSEVILIVTVYIIVILISMTLIIRSITEFYQRNYLKVIRI